MPTDQESTQVSDATAHQTQQDDQNASAHSEKPEFDARRAFDSTNEKVNKLAKTIEKLDPELLTQIAEKIGVQKQVEEEKPDPTADLKTLVKQEAWQLAHEERIAKANENGNYDKYLAEGVKPDLALRLAEQDLGIQVDTSKQDKQKKISSASSTVDRTAPAPRPESLRGYMSEEEYAKYADAAKNVKIIR